MTAPALGVEPACPGGMDAPTSWPTSSSSVRIERRTVADISPSTWDGLASRAPWATPFSAWAVHRAWWDAYGENARDETVVAVRSEAPNDPVAIVPLMHRHEWEAEDAQRRSTLRHAEARPLTPVRPDVPALYFGASYHADYATVLADPGDLPAVADALAVDLAARPTSEWEAIDLRRLRCGDPAADVLADAFTRRGVAHGWSVRSEREDVCPVVRLPVDGTMDEFLAGLDKKARHEIRRKVRRAEAAGPLTLLESVDPLADLEVFIDLHQKRWGTEGLFPDDRGGAQSRLFVRRLFELLGPDGPLRLTFLRIGDRRIAAGLHFDTPDGHLYYNAGVDPDARDLSPGVLMAYAYVERALAAGKRRLDFLRGDEPYKYEWGAVDEPIQRLLVRRAGALA